MNAKGESMADKSTSTADEEAPVVEEDQAVSIADEPESDVGAVEGEAAAKPELTDEERAEIHAANALARARDAALTDMRQRSYEGKLTTPARWKKLAVAPAGMSVDDFAEGLLEFIEASPHAEDTPAIGRMEAPKPLDVQLEGQEIDEDELLPALDVSDVVLLYGKKGTYLYSKPLLSHSFAHALFLTTEDDELATFVDVVRSESRTYPRPVAIDQFMNPPYLWDPAKTLKLFEQVQADGAFKDIERCSASNGKVHFYSTLYLSAAQARSLAEWYEVEKLANP